MIDYKLLNKEYKIVAITEEEWKEEYKDYQIGKYGYLRLDYLKNHKKGEFELMKVKCILRKHIVEIDSLLLYDHNLNATAGEVTAILLHEVGHIIASNGVVCRFERAKEYMTVKFDNKTRKLVPILPFIKKAIFFFIAILILLLIYYVGLYTLTAK